MACISNETRYTPRERDKCSRYLGAARKITSRCVDVDLERFAGESCTAFHLEATQNLMFCAGSGKT